MNKQRNLLYGQALFALLIIIAFGLIIINEKKTVIQMPKVQKKIDSYIDEKYNNLNNINKEKLIFKKNEYILKITSKENSNLYFYIKYNNNTITDTYTEDYLEGNSLLGKIKNDLEKDILTNLKIKTKVEIDTKLNNYNDQIKEKIIKESIKDIKIYNIQTNIIINKWNKEDITESYKIKNLNKDFINNKSNIQIIDDIINEKETNLLKDNKISFEKLN